MMETFPVDAGYRVRWLDEDCGVWDATFIRPPTVQDLRDTERDPGRKTSSGNDAAHLYHGHLTRTAYATIAR